MIVRIQSERSTYINADADVTFSVPVARSYGSATFVISRTSPAFTSEVIDEDGGFLVHVVTHAGEWVGVADRPRSLGGRGIEIRATHIARWLEDLRVGDVGAFIGCTPGTVVRAAFRQALSGRGATAVKLGEVVHAPPVLRTPIEFRRQPVLDVLSELVEVSGQEWIMTNDGTLHWLPSAGVYHDRPPLVDDGTVFTKVTEPLLGDQYDAFIEVNDRGVAYVSYVDDPQPLRPRSKLVNT